MTRVPFIGLIFDLRKNISRSLVMKILNRTTQPLSNIFIEVFNYQKQLIASIHTNNDELDELIVKSKPFLLIASPGKQKNKN